MFRTTVVSVYVCLALFVSAATYPETPPESSDQVFVNEYLQWHRRAQKGDAYAQYRLGYAYMFRCDNPVEKSRSRRSIEIVCADDDRHINDALKWLRWSGQKGTPQAVVLLARLFYHGREDTHPAAKIGDYRLAPDKEQSLDYFLQAFDLAVANAGWSAATILFEQEKESERAISLLREASLLGSILAQFDLADYYENGEYLAENVAEAYRWYEVSRLNHETNGLSSVREIGRLKDLEQRMSATEMDNARLLIAETPSSAINKADDPFYGSIGSHIDWKRR